jgi:hypothetical protein
MKMDTRLRIDMKGCYASTGHADTGFPFASLGQAGLRPSGKSRLFSAAFGHWVRPSIHTRKSTYFLSQSNYGPDFWF